MPAKKVIMVTGGTGLVGKGVEMAIARDGKKPGETWHFVSTKDADLTDRAAAESLFKRIRPTHIIHLAAMVRGLFRHNGLHLELFRVNCLINDIVLSLSLKYDVQKVISCLSTCIFPDQTTFPVDETMIHDGAPHDCSYGYSYAKRMIDIQNRAYHEEYGCQFTSVIPTNLFGPYDNYSLEDAHVLPAFIRKIHDAKENGTPFVMYGAGKALRQFTYSVDLGRLLVWAIREYPEIEPIIMSVGEDDEVSIKEVAQMIIDSFDFQGEFICDISKPDGQYKKTACNDKLLKYLPDFKFTPMKQAIKETCDWFVANKSTARLVMKD